MYLTMNRFKVVLGQEDAFEELWRSRDSHLKQVPGFISFHLLKGHEKDGYRLYASHTAWASEAEFKAWTKSEAFRKAHAGANSNKDMYLGAPELEIFETVQEISV
ncbi:antibiotic biosynthesis monooxygenase family protein [Meridianimarinicoccus aquatilis]|uniref:Antibiotic biosynthesis monooxygenase n=1 Tax=Meridianimarinicoccus aquatilis TaxID=2552766 RepID=A0A4R6B431_9RHOB|nr:antibiotic biosynthesis monooxygenase [Fluviibacterium aquatile]QIE42760.1 antibiotic biosynthesis monooxygenase [Rhodobacteraceae bacterium SC52]TDL91162.1 antibiotic biosynthesis monooxygenase [Fluviibacterium aquatile]